MPDSRMQGKSIQGGDSLMMKEIESIKCQVNNCKENAYFILDSTFPDEPIYSEYPKYTVSIALCLLHADLIKEGTSNELRKIEANCQIIS